MRQTAEIPHDHVYITFAAHSLQFVYVIGLHAVQFGNNWMRKIPRTAKLDEAVGRVQFGSPRNFLNPIISKFDKHVVLLPINYRASENLCCQYWILMQLYNYAVKLSSFALTLKKHCSLLFSSIYSQFFKKT